MTKKSRLFRKIRRNAAENSISTYGRFIYWVDKKTFTAYRIDSKGKIKKMPSYSDLDINVNFYEHLLNTPGLIIYSTNGQKK